LILLGIALFVAEVKAASHGVLAVGGAIALVAGSLLLFSGGSAGEEYRVDLSVVLPALAATLGIVGLLAWKTARLRREPVRTGLSAMVGEAARVVEGFGPAGEGKVQVFGEYWDAAGPEGLAPGETVRIARVTGRTLHVERRNV
jgi:membrane-bound serine protease (ClpP class)